MVERVDPQVSLCPPGQKSMISSTTTDVGGGAPAPTAATSAVATRLSPRFRGGDIADHRDPPRHEFADTRAPDANGARHHDSDGDAHVVRHFPAINYLALHTEDDMLHENVAGSRGTALSDDERSPRVLSRHGRG